MNSNENVVEEALYQVNTLTIRWMLFRRMAI